MRRWASVHISDVVELITRQVVGVIDIDCANINGFDDVDKEGLEQLAKLLAECCDW